MKETRTIEIRATQSAESESPKILEGTAIVFGQPAHIHDVTGDYKEIVERNALKSADLSDVRLLYNHDVNKVPLARTPKTMTLTVDDEGLRVRATLPDTVEANAVYEAVRRGDLNKMSFAFTVPEGGDVYDPKTNTRTIHHIKKVYECSIVPYPAYEQTSIEARSSIAQARTTYRHKQSAVQLINSILGE